MKQLQKIHVINVLDTLQHTAFTKVLIYCLRTSNHQVIQLYDVLIIGVIAVSSHTHLGFVCKGMLDTIIRSIRLSIIKHHQVFSYLNCYVTTKGRLESETVACTGWLEKLAKNKTKKDFFGLLKRHEKLKQRQC